jgi:hypothetical protein
MQYLRSNGYNLGLIAVVAWIVNYLAPGSSESSGGWRSFA